MKNHPDKYSFAIADLDTLKTPLSYSNAVIKVRTMSVKKRKSTKQSI